MEDFARFRPRRSRRRWLEQAPDSVVACYDNGGKTADRYTVLFGPPIWSPTYAQANYRTGVDPRLVPCLAMSGAPTHPQGVSEWCEVLRGPHLGRKVRWLDLPEEIREHVETRALEE